MKNLSSYVHIISTILSGTFPYSRILLLKYYIRFLVKSFYYARVSKTKRQEYRETLFGFVIFFRSFPEFIQLFEEIFVFEVYKFRNTQHSPFIVDCGSNVGISVIYFKLLYPDCRLVAFEPEANNFSDLQKNVAMNNLKNVTCYNAGLSGTTGKANLYRNISSPSLNWMLSKPNGEHQHQEISLHQLSRYINETVDLLKIDVEGAEHWIIGDLLRAGKLELIATLIIEHHPGLTAMTTPQLVKQLNASGFQCRMRRPDIIIGTRS